MASINQYLEVINERLQEENKQGINRADTEQYLQEMSLKYFREYEVEFEKVKEEDKKNLALERVKGFYECLIQIASDDKFDSQFEKTCWSSFIAAHMTMGQCDVSSFEYKSVFIQEEENDNIEEDFKQLEYTLPFLLPITRYYSPVLNFAYRWWLNELSASDALNFLELMDELPYSYWPENLLWYKVLTLMKYGYGEKALEALKFYETLPKNKLRWYYINNIQHRDKYDEMIMDEIDEMTFDKSRIKILYKLNRYPEAQKYIEDYFLKYGQRLQEEEAEWREYEKNIKNKLFPHLFFNGTLLDFTSHNH